MKLCYRLDGEPVAEPAAIPGFSETYDVIVVGLGTAGAIAAIAAAKRGHRVLGIERLNCMGGTGTAGTVQGYYFGSRGGQFEQMDTETKQLAKNGYTTTGGVSGELKKLVLQRHAVEAGVVIRYEASVIGVYRDERRVAGVRYKAADGIHDAGATVLIDSTGDAECCAMAGGTFRLGRESDGLQQPYSNVLKRITSSGAHQFYTDSGYVDPTDGSSVSDAIIDSALRTTHLKERYETEGRFVYIAPQLGIREGRFIEGDCNITLPDFFADRLADNPVFYAYSNLDNHSKDVALESEAYQDWIVGASLWGLNLSVPVPLGAMLPRGLDGLIVAGRCIALDHDMATCVRMKRDMQKCGEAAGIAASLAVERGIAPREVPYAELAALLRATGCLDERNHVGFRLPNAARTEPFPEARWLTDKETIRRQLASESPGIAIWSAKRLGAAISGELKKWMALAPDTHLARNSAIALALLADADAIPLLRQMARERDPFVPQTSRKYNQVRGYTAIYLLGKLADRDIVPDLLALMNDRASFANRSTDAEFINSDDEYYFQYFTFSLAALFRICDKHADLRAPVAKEIESILGQPGLSLSVTLKPSKDQHFEMSGIIRRYAERKLSQWLLPAAGGA